MRIARAKDYWRRTRKRDYTNYIQDINLNDFNGINTLKMEKGIFAICGLNGAGKSTIISAIKELLGINKNKSEILKLQGANVTGHVVLNNKVRECSNVNNNALSMGLEENKILFLDYDNARITMEFFSEEDNLNELLEQNDEIYIDLKNLEEISYLVGKEYTSLKIIEIEDMADNDSIPFFEVVSHGVKYDSRMMGLGEHFLIFLFWKLHKIKENSILILEEPETFIGIESQRHLMDFIAKIVSEKSISTVIATHSPFILENIESKNICILGRLSSGVNVSNPTIHFSVNDILGSKNVVNGTFWVEDNAAEMFLTIILERYAPCLLRKYTIVAVGSESDITKCLKIINDRKINYNFVGVYDGDMKDKICSEELNCKYTFLPMDTNVESVLKNNLLKNNNIKAFCDVLKKDVNQISIFLSSIDGKNYHDWFIELCKYVSYDSMLVMRELSKIWINEHETEIDSFVQRLYELDSD